jgi:pSer/pThr/pTyr-binding forkhead associated (FHA) protein
MRAQLIPTDGNDPIDIVKDLTLVGRREDCDLRLDHKSVSKMHCVIVKTDGLLLLRDLGSTNGTRVNGQRVRRAALLPNDQLSIAGFEFKVYLGPGEAPRGDDEYTQQLDAQEVAKLLRKAEGQAKEKKNDLPALSVQPNALPDVYPDDAPRIKED